MTCPNFPGVWEPSVHGGTARIYHPCPCSLCESEWPCPKVKAGDEVEIAGSHGVFVAVVLGAEMLKEGYFQFYIASVDPAAPDYLRRKVHDRWNVTPRCSLWRLYDPDRRWSPVPIVTRFERQEVL